MTMLSTGAVYLFYLTCVGICLVGAGLVWLGSDPSASGFSTPPRLCTVDTYLARSCHHGHLERHDERPACS